MVASAVCLGAVFDDCEITVAGKFEKAAHLAGPTRLHADVPDVREYYYSSYVLVAPIFYGAGLRVKILEAALCGIPVIITPGANLGINFIHMQEAFICNSLSEFRSILSDYLTGKFNSILDEMRIKAREKIINNFSEEILKNKIKSLLLN